MTDDEKNVANREAIKEELLTYANMVIDGGCRLSDVMVALRSASRDIARRMAPTDSSYRRIVRKMIEGDVIIWAAEMEAASDFERRSAEAFFDLLDDAGFGYGEA
ncbi:MAG: hypothetical protein AAFS01_05435 [Pseudomonadota bacterium]